MDINSNVLKKFCHYHTDEDRTHYDGVNIATVEFDWVEFDLQFERMQEKEKAYYQTLKKLEGIPITFIGKDKEPIPKYGQYGVKPSSNVQLVTHILSYLCENSKSTYIISGSGCDAPDTWTFNNVVELLNEGEDPQSIAATWAKRIIESPCTPTVTALTRIVNQCNDFKIITTNITRSFEFAGIREDSIIRMVDNKIDWVTEKSGIVNIKIGGKRTREGERFFMSTDKPEVLIYLGYGFNTMERMFVNNYPMANLLIIDRRDRLIPELEIRANVQTGTGYTKIVDDLNSIFLKIEI